MRTVTERSFGSLIITRRADAPGRSKGLAATAPVFAATSMRAERACSRSVASRAVSADSVAKTTGWTRPGRHAQRLPARRLRCHEQGSRFRSEAQLARHSGVAPLEASSGRTQRHRLDRGGNRQLNAALYRIAITQARYHPAARAYLDRKRAEGKSRRETIRCLKRLLVRVVYQTLKTSPALT